MSKKISLRPRSEPELRPKPISKRLQGKARLNLLLDEKLKRWAVRYAKRKNTSLTQLITDHFVILRDKEKGIDVQQI